MTICDRNINKTDLMLQVTALNKAILKLNIEQLENEILSFEDILHDALNHPEKANESYLSCIKEKFAKLHLLKQKLASFDYQGSTDI